MELGIVIILLPVIALHVFLAVHGKVAGKKGFTYLSVFMLLLLIAALGFGAFWGVLMMIFILWPPSY